MTQFLNLQLSEVTFSYTEGRRPECKYRVNNNLCIASKRSELVCVIQSKPVYSNEFLLHKLFNSLL